MFQWWNIKGKNSIVEDQVFTVFEQEDNITTKDKFYIKK